MKTQIKKKNKIYGQELILNLEDCDINIISSKEKVREYDFLLCDLIKMKRYGKPFIKRFGLGKDFSAGFSLIQAIETSSIVAHFSEKWKKAYINIFSCNRFDEKKAVEFSKKFFKAKKSKKRILFR